MASDFELEEIQATLAELVTYVQRLRDAHAQQAERAEHLARQLATLTAQVAELTREVAHARAVIATAPARGHRRVRARRGARAWARRETEPGIH